MQNENANQIPKTEGNNISETCFSCNRDVDELVNSIYPKYPKVCVDCRIDQQIDCDLERSIE